MDLVRFGVRLRQARVAMEMSQADCAALAGMPAPTLSALEHGKQDCSASRLCDLAEVLGVSADSLLGLRTVRPDRATAGRGARRKRS